MTGLHADITSGDLARGLRAIRDRLAADLETAERPQDVGRLAKELRDTLAAIAQLPDRQEVSPSDDLAARRAARLANSEMGDSPTAGVDRGS